MLPLDNDLRPLLLTCLIIEKKMCLTVCFQAQNATLEAKANTELSERITSLEQEVTRHREDSGKAQAEVDRLLEILREMENEKNDKDRKINELERCVCV